MPTNLNKHTKKTRSVFKIFEQTATQKKTSHPKKENKTRKKIIKILEKILKIKLADLNFNTKDLIVENFFITQAGVQVFYHSSDKNKIKVYLHLLELSLPSHALWIKPKLIVTIGKTEDNWQFKKLVKKKKQYIATWYSPSLGLKEIKYPKYLVKNEIALKHKTELLFKPVSNPMLKPNSKNNWEAFCTFNPAAVYVADKVHLLYRAQGFDYVSQIGYASSEDGLTIQKRLNKPAYRPSQKFEGATMPLGNPNASFVSGGGCGGCEDPRATVIDNRVYMTYVAYDGWSPPRITLTSIALNDFLDNNILWEKPVLISKPNIVDKSAVIFPEKVNGKYVIMHRVFPNILIDFVDSLDFDGRTYLKGEHKIAPRSNEWWDSRKIGAGAPPLKTKDGWLLIYQAVDDKDASEYKVGAMLLDLNDPTKVLYRSAQPILEPREDYENHGFKAGVVYPCGAVIKDGTLFVYYGGADSYVCVATAKLDKFLNNLKTTGITNLKPSMFGLDQA